MSADSGSTRDLRANSRAPLHAPTTLQTDAFSEPISGYTGDISLGGMFVKMRHPPPVGTLLRFAIELEEPAGIVKGNAEVVWLRARGLAPDQPAGIGVQFRFIEEDGEALLHQAVEKALKDMPPDPQLEPLPTARATSPPRVNSLVGSPLSKAPARKLQRKPASKRSSRPRSKPATTAKENRSEKANDNKILGLPSESAKVILLVILFLVMALLLLRGLG